MNAWYRWGALAALAAVAANGCGFSGSSNGSFPSASFAAGGGVGSPSAPNGAATGGASGSTSGAAAPAALPPESKTESNYQSPVATGNVVWIANPTSGLVAYIDSTTFAVQTIAAGDGPTYLAAIPSSVDDIAIVQNVLSHDATLLQYHQGTLTTTTFPSTVDANSWAVSQPPSSDASTPSARWAIAWTDATRIANPDPTQGFQNIAVLDLAAGADAGAAVILTVGYRPVQVAFSADGKYAYAVTEDGISVIDLLGGPQPAVTKSLPLAAPATTSANDAATEDASDAATEDATTGDAADSPEVVSSDAGTPSPVSDVPAAPDVSFRPDGSYALVRNDGSPIITVVSLPDGATTGVALPGTPTDLTISPSGAFAVAVLRDTSTVAVLPLPGIATAPTSFALIPVAGETIGRAIVTKDGTTALLFTTAAPIDRLTVLTLATRSFRTVTLHAPVLAVFPADDEQNAVVLHNVTPTPGSGVKGAFSLVPIGGDALPASIVSLPAAPTAVAIAAASDRALISLRDDPTSTYGVDLALMPSLEVVPFMLASPPIAVGIVGRQGYVAQDFAEGRITFLDLASEAARTITGFDLGARIVTGSDQ